MDAINELTNINFPYFFVEILIILFAARVVVTLFEWVIDKLGIETKQMRQKREDRELLTRTSAELAVLKEEHNKSVKESNRNDELIKQDISKLADTVNGIASTLEEIQKKANDTKIKELNDSLVKYYNKYKDVGEWSKLEKDAFWALFNDYTARGGDNYAHSIIEPVMRGLREVD